MRQQIVMTMCTHIYSLSSFSPRLSVASRFSNNRHSTFDPSDADGINDGQDDADNDGVPDGQAARPGAGAGAGAGGAGGAGTGGAGAGGAGAGGDDAGTDDELFDSGGGYAP